jgi:histidine triad (HIT) family protein
MKHCIFCKIIRGELPAHKVCENEHVIAFLDIAPINPGHILVIPKEHHESISTVPPEFQQQMMHTAGQIGKALVRSSDYDGFNLHLANGQCAGQVVDHAHLHVIPRVGTDGFHWNWRSGSYGEGEAEELVTKISAKLKL